MKIIILLISLLSFINAQDRTAGKNFSKRSEVIAQNGMACTSQPLATMVAIDILKKGGNAIDAAIAANAMLGLVEPMSCGVGGDIFVILWDAKTKRLYGLNGSGRSPKNLTLAQLKEMGLKKIPIHGPLAVSVPGCVDGWFELSNKFGKLPMSEILAPTIEYAKNGFPVSELIAAAWAEEVKDLRESPGFLETFSIKGNAPAKGDIFKNPSLANTLERIAKNGRDEFYKGETAKQIADFVQANGGFISEEDLADHYSEWVEPVSTNYRGYDVWELPPNGQGIAALQMLNIMEQFDISQMGFGSEEYLHLLIEAKKLAYEDRAKFYADPTFNKIPVTKLISKEYAKERAKLIDLNKAARTYNAGELEDGDTIYLTVADKEGNMVSFIQSQYWGFGSGLAPTGLGFTLQNRGELFTFDENHFNVYEPGKRPFHTIIPAFVTKDNEPYISFGVMGGSMQPQGHVQVLVNIIDFEMGMQEAGDALRIRHGGSSQPTGTFMKNGGVINVESGFDYDVIRGLLNKGHKFQYANGGYGGYQAIKYDAINKVYYGASESRKDGMAAGY